jgi:hypothetical protein
MRATKSIIVAVTIAVLLARAVTCLANIEQNLAICVKKDPVEGYDSDDMNSDWYLGELGFVDMGGNEPEARTLWGRLTFADGDLSGVVFDYNSSRGPGEENPVSESLPVGALYSINSDGTVAIDINEGNQSHLPEGYLSANRQYMVIRHPTVWEPDGDASELLQMALVIKQSTGLGNASLNGTYYFRNLEAYDTSTLDRSATSFWGTMTFDGLGGYTYNDAYGYNSDGNIEGPLAGGGTYSVNTDGSMTITPEPGEPSLYGQLSSDGNVISATIGFEKAAGYRHNGLLVGIKASGRTFSDADLTGEYYYVQLEVDDMEDIFDERGGDVTWGVITFNGSGGFTFEFDDFDSGAISNPKNGSGNYSVSSIGYVEITFTQINSQSCCITAQGHLSDGGQLMSLSDMNDCTDGSGANSGGGDSGGGGGGCFIKAISGEHH